MLNMKKPCVIKEIPEGFLPRGNEEYYPEGIDDFTLVSVIITDPNGKMFCYPNEVAVNFGWEELGETTSTQSPTTELKSITL